MTSWAMFVCLPLVLAAGDEGIGYSEAHRMTVETKKPLLVLVGAQWCGPCKQIAPALEELSSELAGRVTIAKLNIDDHPELAVRYNIRSIPMLALFDRGSVKSTKVGAWPKGALREWLDGALG